MFIAIDDTYSDPTSPSSKYVTSNRRTHVAVIFSNEEAQDVREQLPNCLDEINKQFKLNVSEFHFKDIINKKGEWKKLPKQMKLAIIGFFATIYRHHRWGVIIQTVDERTLPDLGPLVDILSHDVPENKKNSELSIALLLLKIRRKVKEIPEHLTIIMDEGIKQPGEPFGYEYFQDRSGNYHGYYGSSKTEPLLQIADFMAYCINRTTYLAMKPNRSDDDNIFLEIISSMNINSTDIKKSGLDTNFTIDDFDAFHENDRKSKGLK